MSTDYDGVPVWAHSMVDNYIRMYRQAYGVGFTGTGKAVWRICNTVYDDTDKAEQDNARVEAMRELGQ